MAALILAGCGGSSHPNQQLQLVRGPGFRFRAPASWHVTNGTRSALAKDGGDFVQVTAFPLARRYTDGLFAAVQTELATRMADVAQRAGGTVTGHDVVTVDGRRAHTYDVRVGKRRDRYTFVLRGKREFLLLCAADASVCDELAASFVAG